MKNTGAKTGKWIRSMMILLLVLLIGAGITFFVIKRQSGRTFAADLEGYESAAFAPMGSGFAALSEVSIRLFGKYGEALASLQRSYSNGMIVGSKTAAAVWSEGGSKLSILHSDGHYRDLSYSGGITAVDLNDKGDAVVLAGEKGYKGFVDVIRQDGTEAYRVFVASGYPLDVDIAPDSRHIAILSMTVDGSRLSVYSLSSEEPLFEWNAEELFFDLEYLPGGRIFLISSEKAVILTSAGAVAGEYDFGGGRLLNYAATGTSGVVLALGQYQTGTTERLVTLNNDALEIASMETEAGIIGLSAAGGQLAVLGKNEIRLFDWSLNERLSLSSAAGVQAVMVRADGSAILISGGGAATIEP